MSQDKYLRPEEASKLLKVTNQTLVNWDNKGKIKCTRTKGNHRRYLLSDIVKLNSSEQKNTKRKICYCRVSTHSQKEDLERQVEFFRHNYPNHEIIQDFGSGINFKRKGFKTLVDEGIKGNIQEIVVTHKDRLCRFGFDLIENIISEYSNGKIMVLNQQQTSPQEELVTDLISIITVFSSRLYGLRSHDLKKKIKEQALKNTKNEIIPNKGRTGRNKTDDGTV
jgi:excisionase family DNA binding protein